LISFALSLIVTVLIPEASEIFLCETFSSFFITAKRTAAAAIDNGFLLADIPFFSHNETMLKATLSVFSDA
jgi:hypothetical protein